MTTTRELAPSEALSFGRLTEAAIRAEARAAVLREAAVRERRAQAAAVAARRDFDAMRAEAAWLDEFERARAWAETRFPESVTVCRGRLEVAAAEAAGRTGRVRGVAGVRSLRRG